MKRHLFRQLLLVAAISTVLTMPAAWGQEEHTVPVSPIGPELPYTELLKPPLPVSGLQMPLMFSSETARSNFVMGNLQVGSAYDDNLFSTASNHISNVSYLVLPSIDIVQTRERWNWDFGYSPGFTINNQRLVERNQSTHDLHLLFDYRLSPHVTAQIRENFQKFNGLFSSFVGGTSSAGPGPLQQPNTSVVTPFSDRTSNTTGLDLTYQFGAGSLVGASGNFYFVNYDTSTASTVPSYGLIDSRSWGGNAFYAHRFSNRQWVGATYNFQRLLFDPGYRTDVNRTFLFYSISAGTHLTLSIWAGPEQTTSVIPNVLVSTAGMTSSQTHWDVAGGSDLTWQGKRTSLRVGYTRQTTDGGGLAQAVNLQQVTGEVQERLTARWTGKASLEYARNNPLNAVNGAVPYRSWVGSAGFDYRVTENIGLGLNYGRDQLRHMYSASPAVSAYRNRAWFSVSYSFSRALGR